MIRKRHLWLLRWATVVLPLAYLTITFYVGHFVLPSLIHTYIVFLALLALSAVGVTLFSYFVFNLIERADRQALSRHQELLTLNTVAAAASQPMSLEGLLQVAVDGVVEAVGVDGGLVCVLDEPKRELMHVACHGIPDSLLGPLRKVKLDEHIIAATVVSTGQPVQIRDITQDTRISEIGRKSGFRSVISLPLKSEGKIKGVMALVSRSTRGFDPSQVQFLLTLGGQLAVAIERTQLQQQVANMAVLTERERIAREMHDGLAQVLGYINAKTSAISRYLADGDVEDARQEVIGLRDAAREVYADVREAILGLRLASSEPGQLWQNVREYSASFSSLTGIPLSLEGLEAVEELRLGGEAEAQLLRIVQEALTNVRKHAQASKVSLGATQEDGRLHLFIADNGRGFDKHLPEGAVQRSFGIQTMRERAESAGGSIWLETTPGSGTRVSVTVPLLEKREIA